MHPQLISATASRNTANHSPLPRQLHIRGFVSVTFASKGPAPRRSPEDFNVAPRSSARQVSPFNAREF